MTWVLVIAALDLAGAMCYAMLVTPTGEQHPAPVRAAVWLLWALAGLVSVAVVGVSMVHLASPHVAKPFVGESIIGIVMGGLFAYAAVPLLGIAGFWAAVARLLKR